MESGLMPLLLLSPLTCHVNIRYTKRGGWERCPHIVTVHTVTGIPIGGPGSVGFHHIQECWMMESGLMPLPLLPPLICHVTIRYSKRGGWERCPHIVTVHTVTGIPIGSPGSVGFHHIQDCWMMESGLMPLPLLPPLICHVSLRPPLLLQYINNNTIVLLALASWPPVHPSHPIVRMSGPQSPMHAVLFFCLSPSSFIGSRLHYSCQTSCSPTPIIHVVGSLHVPQQLVALGREAPKRAD